MSIGGWAGGVVPAAKAAYVMNPGPLEGIRANLVRYANAGSGVITPRGIPIMVFGDSLFESQLASDTNAATFPKLLSARIRGFCGLDSDASKGLTRAALGFTYTGTPGVASYWAAASTGSNTNFTIGTGTITVNNTIPGNVLMASAGAQVRIAVPSGTTAITVYQQGSGGATQTITYDLHNGAGFISAGTGVTTGTFSPASTSRYDNLNSFSNPSGCIMLQLTLSAMTTHGAYITGVEFHGAEGSTRPITVFPFARGGDKLTDCTAVGNWGSGQFSQLFTYSRYNPSDGFFLIDFTSNDAHAAVTAATMLANIDAFMVKVNAVAPLSSIPVLAVIMPPRTGETDACLRIMEAYQAASRKYPGQFSVLNFWAWSSPTLNVMSTIPYGSGDSLGTHLTNYTNVADFVFGCITGAIR